MRVALIGHDQAPSEAFSLLVPFLEARGAQVSLLVGFGKSISGEIEEVVANSEKILVGMSSSPEWAKEEIQSVRTAILQGKTFGFYSDSFTAFKRDWFSFAREKAQFLCLSADKAVEAGGLFPNARIEVTGNPTHEKWFLTGPPADEVFKKVGIESGEYILLVGGVKFESINRDLLTVVFQAAEKLQAKGSHSKCGVRVIFAPHPGEPDLEAKFVSYQKQFSVSRVESSWITRKSATSSELLSIADVYIESTSSVGQEAACKRIPVLTYLNEEAKQNLVREMGTPIWEPAHIGITLDCEGDPKKLEEYLLANDFSALHARQAEVMKEPAQKGAALYRMAELVTRS